MSQSKKQYDFTLIETEPKMREFYEQNRSAPWLAFDTEFIPERYYRSRLCVISAVTIHGNYIIDVLKTPDITPFIRLVEDNAILKITHAGENDYRILELDYDVKPRNLFDTQLAYGFLNYEYPCGLQALVRRELGQKVRKAELRSNWEKRPLTDLQLSYSIGDVHHLFALKEHLEEMLTRNGKLEWVREEMTRWEEADYYKTDPIDQISKLPLQNLSTKKKVFLIRLYDWREEEAGRTNRPVNRVVKSQFLKNIAQNFSAGKAALLSDRIMPHGLLREHWDRFSELYDAPVSPEEQELLNRLPDDVDVPPQQAITMDLLHQLIKLTAANRKVSPLLILARKEIKNMQSDQDYFPEHLARGWRKELLGEELSRWLRTRNIIQANIEGHACVLTMDSKRETK